MEMENKKRVPRLESRRKKARLSYRDLAELCDVSHIMARRVCLGIDEPWPPSKQLKLSIRDAIEGAIKMRATT